MDHPDRTRLTDWTRRAAALVVVIGLAGILVLGADRPANPSLIEPGVALPARVHGFAETAFLVQAAPGLPGGTRLPCALYARDESQRRRGLMGQHSLDGYAGMIFAFPTPTTTRFYMRETPLPLSIAWFDQNGVFIAATDMPPCPPGLAACPQYPSPAPYTVAIEVSQGQLPSIGIGPGSTLHLDGPCIG